MVPASHKFYTNYWALRSLAANMKKEMNVQDRLVEGTVFSDAFFGIEAVAWLEKCVVANTSDAVRLGNLMLDAQIFRHVYGSHFFENSEHVYAFNNINDSDAPMSSITEADLSNIGIERLAWKMRKSLDIKDRTYLLKLYRKCFIGSSAVNWLQEQLGSEQEAISIGNMMIAANLFHHVCDEHLLKNDTLFYRFTVDEDSDGSGGSSNSVLDGISSLIEDVSETNIYGSISESFSWIAAGAAKASTTNQQSGLEISPSDLSYADLKSMVEKMKAEIHVHDKLYVGFVSYKRCFYGSDFVRWLSSQFRTSEEDALRIGNMMIALNLIQAVTGDVLKNKKIAYQFVEDLKSSTVNPPLFRDKERSSISSYEDVSLDDDPEDNIPTRLRVAHTRAHTLSDFNLSNSRETKVRSDIITIVEPPPNYPAFSFDQLRTLAIEMRKSVVVKDRKYHFRTYSKCWLGCDGVVWLTKALGSEREAVVVGDMMINVGLFKHVVGDHMLKKEDLFYRFQCDDDELEEDLTMKSNKNRSMPEAMDTITAYPNDNSIPHQTRSLKTRDIGGTKTNNEDGPSFPAVTNAPPKLEYSMVDTLSFARDMKGAICIKDYVFRGKTYQNCFQGCDAVTWMVAQKGIQTEENAKTLGDMMISLKIFYEVTDGYPTLSLRNEPNLYRYREDEVRKSHQNGEMSGGTYEDSGIFSQRASLHTSPLTSSYRGIKKVRNLSVSSNFKFEAGSVDNTYITVQELQVVVQNAILADLYICGIDSS
jgi:hypothetical protein